MKTNLEKIKVFVEIFAIVVAGCFAVFTWGVDSIRLSAPSWGISFNSIVQNTAIEENGTVYVCSCPDCNGSTATSINLSGRIEIENKGKLPINVKSTEIEVYLVDKFADQDGSGILNNSPYKYYEETKDLKPTTCFTINSVDNQVLFQGHESWRPFELSITPLKLSPSITLEEAIRGKEILILVNQKIKPDSFFRKEKTSSAIYHIPNILNRARPLSEDL